MMRLHTRLAAIAAVAAMALTLAACGDDNDDAAAGDAATDNEMVDEDMAEDDMSDEEMMDEMAAPVGPGCADYADAVPDGEGSIDGMADDPVTVAASNNPLLTTLVSAVSGELNPDVDLVDTLNGDEFTVFAPVDMATLDAFGADADLLRSVLTYHVVPGQIGPDEIVGEHETVNGASITVEGEPEALAVNDATVICGGVHTANATVYLIDAVLLPPE